MKPKTKPKTRRNTGLTLARCFARFRKTMVARIRQPGRRAPKPSADLVALGAAVAIAAGFAGLNMFGFPAYENDEGTYVGSAWAMYQQGQLSYYTYTYDHPPFGWFLIGAWASLVGGFFTFGTAIDTARVMMLVVTILSTLLIFLIVRRVTGRATAALFAALVFAVSPLGVSLHRGVWLDNIATLWLLVSLYILITSRGRVGHVALSALAFGLAFWTKEVFVVFLPGFLYLSFTQAHLVQRRFASVVWGTIAVSVISWFVLMALANDEFLPPGVLWSSLEPHVSMIDTYLYQISRGSNEGLLNPEGEFWKFFGQWSYGDPVLVLGGLAASGVGLLFWRRDRVLFGVSVLVFSFLLFLGRGGVVLYWYVIPLLALLAIVLGLFASRVADLVRWRPPLGRTLPVAVLVLTLVLGGAQANWESFTLNSTSSQRAAARWIVDNLPSNSTIIMDTYAWADLRDPSFTGGPAFWNAHYYFPAASDPEVRSDALQDDWRNIDYLAVSPSTEASMARDHLPLVEEAWANSDEVRGFSSGDWWVEILRVRKLHQLEAPDDPLLANTWEGYKERFVEGGRVIDPQADRRTTSEGQSYAMLRAVYMDDRQAFDEVWRWTEENLRVREDGLLAWQWGTRSDGALGMLDRNTATDGDQDAALALLFAARRWDTPEYEQEALEILRGIWEQETTVIDEERVVTAGSSARGDDGGPVVTNPSYFAPYAYRIFAEADPEHDWMDLVDSSYRILEQVRASSELGGEAGLAPDWLALDSDSGKLLSADGLVDSQADKFSYDASRLPLRLSLDWLWFEDERALEAIRGLSFPRQELEREGQLLAAYQPDGSSAADYESMSMYAGVLPGLLISEGEDPQLAHKVFSEKILTAYVNDAHSAYWGEDADNYYNQNMAWFATAMMDGAMSNLWRGERVIDWEKKVPGESSYETTDSAD
jgi:endo-1,4-beta-D-glucanase Y/4-amino-4-deoxy-L-arabinose transferase-like glycosyltransferase